ETPVPPSSRVLLRATTSDLIASVRPLDPPDVSAVDGNGQRLACDRALSDCVVPHGQATVAVETAGRLLRLDRQHGLQNRGTRPSTAARRHKAAVSERDASLSRPRELDNLAWRALPPATIDQQRAARPPALAISKSF